MEKIEQNKTFDTIFRVESAVAKVELFVTSTLFISMLSIMMYQIICRYLLGVSTVWAEELVRYLFITTTFMGAAVAIVRHDHIEIDVLDGILRGKIKKQATRILVVEVINVFRYLVIAVLMTFVTLYGYRFSIQTGSINQLSPAMKLPMIYVHMLVTLGYAMTVIHSLMRVVESIVYPKDI